MNDDESFGGDTPLRMVADLLSVGVIVGDAEGAATFANRRWSEMTGQAGGQWLGFGWLLVLPAEKRARALRWTRSAIEGRQSVDDGWEIVRPDGRAKTLAVSVAAATSEGTPIGFTATVVDDTEAQSIRHGLVHAATHDPLTGLLNRLQVDHIIRNSLERRRTDPGTFVAVLFIDVDDLKAVNDLHGHGHGDRLLQRLAHRIKGAVRPEDVVVRYGGDEFVVICDGMADPIDATQVAQRIIDAAANRGSSEDSVGVSVGIAYTDDPDGRPTRLIDLADAAMYRAKREGGGLFGVTPADHTTS